MYRYFAYYMLLLPIRDFICCFKYYTRFATNKQKLATYVNKRRSENELAHQLCQYNLNQEVDTRSKERFISSILKVEEIWPLNSFLRKHNFQPFIIFNYYCLLCGKRTVAAPRKKFSGWIMAAPREGQ